MRRRLFKWLASRCQAYDSLLLVCLWDGILDLGLYSFACKEFKREFLGIVKSIQMEVKENVRRKKAGCSKEETLS